MKPDNIAIDIGKPPKNRPGSGLQFSNLTYTVIKKKKENGKWVSKEADLLHNIIGHAPRGCVTAVMGPSGAGKSTLLDGLAGRIASGSLKGSVSLDGMDTNPSLIKRTSAYIMQDDRLFPMLTVYETLMFAADFRLGSIPRLEKQQRVENLIEQLGLSTSRHTYIGDEGTRGVSGGERRRVSIGVDIIHGPTLLFLDEPTSGLDSTSAHSVVEKIHDIARSGSTVILTIHQPSSRIMVLLDHLIVLARGQLMYQGSPREVAVHVGRMGRKVPKGENPIECLIDVIQEYDQSKHGVEAVAEFALTGTKPPSLADDGYSIATVVPTPGPAHRLGNQADGRARKRPPIIQADDDGGFDSSVRSPWNNGSRPWNQKQGMKFTPTRQHPEHRSLSPGYYMSSTDMFQGTPTPHSSEWTLDEDDYRTPGVATKSMPPYIHLNPKFMNSFFSETWILMRRNFTNIRRTPELFLSRLVVLVVMGFMMATMFWRPKTDTQGITDRLSFFIFTVCLFFFSSNDAVPAFIQERFIFLRESSHNAYRASSYTIAGLITNLPFLLIQASAYAIIVWFSLKLRGPFYYFLLVLYLALLSTNSFVVFISAIVPNYILGYAAVIAFSALFFLFCGYFLSSYDIPVYWRWMNYISTMTYPYEGLLMNEYQSNVTFGINPLGENVTGFGILNSLHIDVQEAKKWEKVYIMIGWAFFYRILFYIILRFFSKNQRT